MKFVKVCIMHSPGQKERSISPTISIRYDDILSGMSPSSTIGILLNIDEDKYLKYEQRCLTSTKSLRSNAQIILEDIMNIQCDPY